MAKSERYSHIVCFSQCESEFSDLHLEASCYGFLLYKMGMVLEGNWEKLDVQPEACYSLLVL